MRSRLNSLNSLQIVFALFVMTGLVIFSSPVIARNQSYQELSTSITALRARIASKEQVIEELLAERNQTRDSARLAAILREINVEHQELRELYQRLRTDLHTLQFRFPERSGDLVQSGDRVEVPTIEQLEVRAGIDRQLDDLFEIIHRHYGVIQQREPASAPDGQGQSLLHSTERSREPSKKEEPVFSPIYMEF